MITGQIDVDVPEHVEDVSSYVFIQLQNREVEVNIESELQCDKCRHWFVFNEFNNHFC